MLQLGKSRRGGSPGYRHPEPVTEPGVGCYPRAITAGGVPSAIDTPDVRHPVHGGGDVATPGVLNRGTCQLRVDLQHRVVEKVPGNDDLDRI